MKKLTAGIFTVLMGLVSVNAADAAVASKGYVDKLTGDVATAFGPGTGVVAGSANLSQAANELSEAIGNMQSSTYINTLETEEKTLTGAVNDLDSRVTTNTGHIGSATFNEENLKIVKNAADLTVAIKELDEAVTVASGDLTNVYTKTDADAKFIDTDEITGYATDAELNDVSEVANAADTLSKENATNIQTQKNAINVLRGDENTAGSVAEKIKNATTAITDAYEAADTATLNSAKAYTNEQIEALDLQAISRVPAACGTAGNYCVLTTNGTNFVWEVIVREDTTLGEGDTGLYAGYPATESTVTQ